MLLLYYGTEAEIQLGTTEEVSRFQCLFHFRTGWCGGASHHQKLAPIPMGV